MESAPTTLTLLKNEAQSAPQSESRTPRVQKGSRHATRVFRRGKLAIRSPPLDIAQDGPGVDRSGVLSF